MIPSTENRPADVAERQRLMAVCAWASEAELEAALAACGGVPEAEDIRAPEEGLVMLRGRIGGGGAPFNVGEATVTRAVVRLPDGALGYAYVLGRSPRKARLAAMIDALGQNPDWRAELEAALLPVKTRRAREDRESREEAAATRVDFFTLVRGED